MISAERYLATVYPIHYSYLLPHTRRKRGVFISTVIFINLFIMVLVLPPVIIHGWENLETISQSHLCIIETLLNHPYNRFIQILSQIVPLLCITMIGIYIKIFKVINKKVNSIRPVQNPNNLMVPHSNSSSLSNVTRSRLKTAKEQRVMSQLLFLVLILSFISYLFLAVVHLLVVRRTNHLSSFHIKLLQESSRLIYYVSSMLNPILYAYKSKSIRTCIAALFGLS